MNSMVFPCPLCLVSLHGDYAWSGVPRAWRAMLGSDHISGSDMDVAEHVYPHPDPRPTCPPFSATVLLHMHALVPVKELKPE